MVETTPDTQVTKKSKRWQDLSPATKTRITVQGMVQGLINLLLIIWAIRDLRRRPASQINGNKKVWTLVAFATPVGPMIYFLFGRKRSTPTEGMHVSDERTGE
jgi:hypothetical protein